MKKLLIIGILALSLGAISIACDDPGIVFTFEEYDFGAVEQDKTLTAVFMFKNAGKRTLLIERVQPT